MGRQDLAAGGMAVERGLMSRPHEERQARPLVASDVVNSFAGSVRVHIMFTARRSGAAMVSAYVAAGESR